MKKSLSLILAIVMVFTVFTAAIVPVSAAFTVANALTVTDSGYVNDQITYTISVKSGVKCLTGVTVKASFDPNALSMAGSTCTEKLGGINVAAFNNGSKEDYSFSYINANATGVSVSADTALFTITFKGKNADRAKTTVEFSCVEFITEDGVANDLEKKEEPATIREHELLPLSKPVMQSADSVDKSIKVQWSAVAGASYYKLYRKASTESAWVVVGGNHTTNVYVDNAITSGIEYSYVAVAVNKAGIETEKGSAVTGLYFGEVTGVTAGKNANGNGILVKWNALNGAENYTVERTISGKNQWQSVAAKITSAQFDDTSAASGVTYQYRVRAFKGKYSADTSGAYPTAVYLAKPTISLANVGNGIQVTVGAVGGAQQYIIQKSVDGGAFGTFKTLTSSTLSFVDTDVAGGKKYAYNVQAVAGTLKSDLTAQVAATRLATPTLKTVENVNDGVTVRWGEVSADKLFTSYDIYRKTGNGAYTLVGTSTTLSYNDTSAVGGTTYTYTVVAKNSTGISGYDNTGLTIKRLSTPANIVSRTNAKGIYITWNAVAGASGYTIYRNGTKVGTSTTTRFEDTGAAKNTIFKYTVRADSGTYYSAIDSTGAQGMNFGTISSLKYTAIKNGITLTWNSLSNAEGYRVYRKTASDSAYTRIATVTSGTSYNDVQMSSGVAYYYCVEAYKGTVVADMSAPVLSAKYLSAPVFTAKNSGEGKVKISVTAVRGADKYVIERADGASTKFVGVATLTGGTLEYIDTKNIVAGQKYTYRVRALANDGTRSFDSVVSMTKMIAPKLTSCYNEVAGVQLKWTAVDGATQYIVYRRLPGAKEWKSLATLGRTQTAFLDASVVGNNVYQYTVEAKTADGYTGYDDIGRECRFIETPDLISRTNAVGGVTIKWNKVAGATSYRIYRRGAGVNYWYYLGDFPATLDTFTDLETANYFPNDAKKNAEAKPKSGNYYRYTVRASYEGKDSYGKPYTIYSGFDTNGLYLKYVATPKLKAVSNAGNGITVTWNAVNGGGSTWYRVYRRGAGSTYWYYLGATQKTSFTDTKIANANNRYYRYTVRAVAGTADKGWYSAFDTTGLYLKRLVNPVLVSATSANGGITVKWKPVAGTTGYYVYRKTANSTWTRVGTVGGTNNTTFIDKNASRGVTYTYTVRACYGRTLSSYNTKGVSARR